MGWTHEEPSDVALVAAIGDRRREALGEIYRRYGGAVWWVAERVCRSADLAEEVCAAVFTDLWSHPQRFDPSRRILRSHLVAEAHSRAIEVARSDGVHRRERDAGIDVAALANEARRAMDQLATDERDAILLAYVGGPAYIEDARLQAPEHAVKSRIRRGLLNLRRALEVEGVTT